MNTGEMKSKTFCALLVFIASSSVAKASYYKCAYSGISTTPPVSVSPDDLSKGRNATGSIERSNPLPSWINFRKVRQGQKFARNNLLGLMAAAYAGIPYVAIPDISNMILLTSSTTVTPDTLTHRFLEQVAQIFVWYNFQNEDDGSWWYKADPNSTTCSFCASLHNVRQIHINAMHTASNAGPSPFYNSSFFTSTPVDDAIWDDFYADLQASNISAEYRTYTPLYESYDGNPPPVNQFSMAVTQFALIGYLILDPESVYINNASDEDLEAFVHLWAVIGYGIGIDDQYNICLKPTLNETRKYFKDIHEKYYIPTLFNLDHDRKVLLEQFIGTVNIPGLSNRELLMWYLRYIIKIPADNLQASLALTGLLSEYIYYTFYDAFQYTTKLPYVNRAYSWVLESVAEIAMAEYFGMQNVTTTDYAQYVFYKPPTMNRLNCPVSKATPLPSLSYEVVYNLITSLLYP